MSKGDEASTFERETGRMTAAGVGYTAAGGMLVWASYTVDGWPRWPLGVCGWLLLVVGTWTLLFRIVVARLARIARRVE